MVKGKRNGLAFTECSVKICWILLLSPPYWKWSYHNAMQSECAHRLEDNIFQIDRSLVLMRACFLVTPSKPNASKSIKFWSEDRELRTLEKSHLWNGKHGTRNGFTPVISIRIQNSGWRRAWAPVLSTRSFNSDVGVNSMAGWSRLYEKGF